MAESTWSADSSGDMLMIVSGVRMHLVRCERTGCTMRWIYQYIASY